MSRRCKTARDDWQLLAAVNGFAAIPAGPAELPLPRDAGGGGRRQRAGWRESPHRRGTPLSGLPGRRPPGKARRPRPGTPDVSQRDSCA